MPGRDEKDESFDATLARALGRSRESLGGCPDATILAAYHEGKLRKVERASWEGHFAGCSRCQARLASLGRTAAPNHALAAEPQAEEPGLEGGAARWARFAIPGVAAIVVLAIIVILLSYNHTPTVTNAPVEAKPTSVTRARVAAPAANATAASATRQQHKEEQARAEALTQAKEAERAKERALAAAAVAARLARETPAPKKLASNEAGASAVESTTPALQPAARAARAQKVALAAPPKQVAPRPMLPPPGHWVTVKPPGSETAWKVGAGGKIYHQTAPDQWKLEFTGSQADLFAGSAPSPTVCWVLGRHRTILRTTDGGLHWQLTAAPSSSAHLTWIAAMNGEFATVTLSNGHRYSTFDGGQTWRGD